MKLKELLFSDKPITDLFTEKPILTLIKYTLLFSIIINGFGIFSNYYTISSFGYGGFHVSCLYYLSLIFLFLPSFFMIPISAFGLIFRRYRNTSFRILIFCVMYVVLVIICMPIDSSLRMNGFRKLAERSAYLITAINNYEQKYQHPPETLEKLVPEFIAKVPDTGMPAYPNYEYATGSNVAYYENNPWVIIVYTDVFFLGFDKFMYFPKQNYPEGYSEKYSGDFERIKDWAYLHE